jgi:hypothetical protein
VKRIVALLVVVSSAGCAYYNAMWSAERFAKQARRAEGRGQVSEARSQWALAAAKAERVVIRHPRSRWADDALALQAEGLARSGSCDEAVSVINRVQESVKDPALLERVALVDAECALSAGRAKQADAALVAPLASKDEARRSHAELLAGRAAALRLDYAGAVEHFERSREPGALAAHARVLIAGGKTAEATAVVEALTGPHFELERGELLTQLGGAAGSEAASRALDRLLTRGKRIPLQEQARLLNADADRRLASGDHHEAAARYRRAAVLAPPATPEASAAAAGVQRVAIAGVMQRGELKPIETELARLSVEPGAVNAKRLLDLVRQALVIGETPAAGFRVAELARDSLGAPALAGDLFLAVAARDTASLYAPKALVAALALLPERRDSIVAILDARYAMSPYTRAFHGEPSVAYAAAEDSLARELGVQIARSTVTRTGARVELPVPGPRGPQLEDGPLTRGAAARPTNRGPATPRERPPANAPDRP